MKNCNLMLCLLVTMLIVNTGCKKNTEPRNNTPPVNTPPVAIAGADINLEIPLNYTTLSGTTHDADGDIPLVDWTKISGPQSFLIEWENTDSPKLSFLEEGIYEFEYRVIDAAGSVVKDTVKVTVSSNLHKLVIKGSDFINQSNNLPGISVPAEVYNNLKWVFCNYGEWCEQADNGPLPGIDYWLGGGSYYERLSSDIITYYGYDNLKEMVLYY